MMKLKFQEFGHLLWRTDLFEKKTDPGEDWRQEKGMTEHEMLDGITDSMDLNMSKLREIVKKPGVLHFMGLQGNGYN